MTKIADFKIPYAEKNSQTTYIVSCIGPCRQITAFLEVASGDADLYAREDRAPVIEVSSEVTLQRWAISWTIGCVNSAINNLASLVSPTVG